MGFFDKLFNGNGNEVLGKIKDMAENAVKEAGDAAKSAMANIQNDIQEATANKPADSDPAPYGVSWGETMPDEPNQYNFPGDYVEYFSCTYAEAFPSYRLTKESIRKGRATLITFWEGDKKALVVELKSENSSAVSIELNCRKEGVPYLNFYYNHDGWWNTKNYVINRTRAALGK